MEPEECARDFIESHVPDGDMPLVESLKQPAQALNAAREIMAQQLAVDPDMCKKVRQHFEQNARVVLTATLTPGTPGTGSTARGTAPVLLVR